MNFTFLAQGIKYFCNYNTKKVYIVNFISELFCSLHFTGLHIHIHLNNCRKHCNMHREPPSCRDDCPSEAADTGYQVTTTYIIFVINTETTFYI